MKSEEKKILKLQKFEKDRSELMVYFVGLIAAFMLVGVPLMLTSVGNTKNIIAGILIVALVIIGILFIPKYSENNQELNKLYKELMK